MWSLREAPVWRSTLLPAIVVAVAWWLGVLTLNLPSAKIDFLIMASGDDLAFYQVVLRMYDAALALDARNFFNISFQTYGMAYFVVQLVAAAPAFALEAWDEAALVLRMLPAFWAAGTIVLVAVFVRRMSDQPLAPVLAALLLVAMPGFWTSALWNHPDHMMVFFLVAAFFRAGDRNGVPGGKDVFAVGILLALALSSKFQAVVAAPGLALLFAWPFLTDRVRPWPRRLAASVRSLALLFAVTVGAFAVFNPYLLHPLGLWAFWDELLRNISSNQTNHGAYTTVLAGEKIQVVETYFFDRYAAAALVAAAAIALACPGASRKQRFRVACAGAAVAAFAGLVSFGANKAWDFYYLIPFVAVGAFVPMLLDRRARPQAATTIAAALMLAAAVFTAIRIPMIVPSDKYAGLDVAAVRKQSAALAEIVKDVVRPGAQVLVSPRTPLPLTRLGLRPDALRVIDGPRLADYMEEATRIVIRKDDFYFDSSAYVYLARHDLPHRSRMEAVRDRVQALVAGTDSAFRPCGESAAVYVFCANRETVPQGTRTD